MRKVLLAQTVCWAVKTALMVRSVRNTEMAASAPLDGLESPAMRLVNQVHLVRAATVCVFVKMAEAVIPSRAGAVVHQGFQERAVRTAVLKDILDWIAKESVTAPIRVLAIASTEDVCVPLASMGAFAICRVQSGGMGPVVPKSVCVITTTPLAVTPELENVPANQVTKETAVNQAALLAFLGTGVMNVVTV